MQSEPLISVVDDDGSVRRSLGRLLRSVGYAAELFPSAEEFLHSGRAGASDGLILDVRMPGMSGFELYRHLAATGSAVPVVFITAHECESKAPVSTLGPGVVDCLRKPFGDDVLLSAVRAAVGRRRPNP